MGHGHYGNKKKEADDGWPPKGCSPPLALLKLLRSFSCPGAAQHWLATAGCEQTRAMPLGTTSLPSRPGSHKERPGEEHGCQESTARPAGDDTGRSHPATQKKIKNPLVRMKGPPTDSRDNQKSVPGNPECLLPPLPSDSRNNLDLRPSPFHPSAPTPYSSPAQLLPSRKLWWPSRQQQPRVPRPCWWCEDRFWVHGQSRHTRGCHHGVPGPLSGGDG